MAFYQLNPDGTISRAQISKEILLARLGMSLRALPTNGKYETGNSETATTESVASDVPRTFGFVIINGVVYKQRSRIESGILRDRAIRGYL